MTLVGQMLMEEGYQRGMEKGMEKASRSLFRIMFPKTSRNSVLFKSCRPIFR